MTLIPRSLSGRLADSLGTKPIIILYGARQVGKSTLLQHLLAHNTDILWLSGDDPHHREDLREKGIQELQQLIGNTKTVVIDEAQLIPNIGWTLKLIADHLPGVQIIATGSSSFELANRLHEPLTGRNRTLTLLPMSLSELTSIASSRELTQRLTQYLLYGMYPASILASGHAEREATMREIARDYIYKDVLAMEGIRSPETLRNLLTLLALRVGSEIVYADLAQHLGKSRETVIRYVDILEQAFIVFRVRPFVTNREKEVTKRHKIYFFDNGIRNAVIGNFDPLDLRTDHGALFENFCASEIYKRFQISHPFATLHFWKSYNGAEVDLVVSDGPGRILTAYECKYSKTTAKVPELWQKTYQKPITLLHQGSLVDIVTKREEGSV